MTPRLKSSRRWTRFPDEYMQMIRELFTKEFAAQLGPSKLFIEGRIYPNEIVMRVGYLENGKITQNNFDASVEYNAQKENVIEAIHATIDGLASLLVEHFASQPELPRTWQPILFEKRQIFIQYNTENTELEAQADRLLKENHSPHLVNEEPMSEDLMDRDPEDENGDLADDSIDLLTPSLFSGKGAKAPFEN